MNKPVQIINFQFDKKDILALNLSPYLEKLEFLVSSKENAEKFMHQVVFHVSGYDLDPRGLSVIPEVISFFTELHKQWPYFLYFSIPHVDNFAWWMAVIYFPVVGREDGNVSYLEVTPERYASTMNEFFSYANGLAEVYHFNKQEYLDRQAVMVDAINLWCVGKAV